MEWKKYVKFPVVYNPDSGYISDQLGAILLDIHAHTLILEKINVEKRSIKDLRYNEMVGIRDSLGYSIAKMMNRCNRER